jgi:hypothetical protein
VLEVLVSASRIYSEPQRQACAKPAESLISNGRIGSTFFITQPFLAWLRRFRFLHHRSGCYRAEPAAILTRSELAAFSRVH